MPKTLFLTYFSYFLPTFELLSGFPENLLLTYFSRILIFRGFGACSRFVASQVSEPKTTISPFRPPQNGPLYTPKPQRFNGKMSNCDAKNAIDLGQEAVKPMSLNGCLGPTERGAWRGVGRKGWQKRLTKGWRKVGERLAKGWRRVGEGLAKGWRRVGGFPCTLQFRKTRGAHLETRVCDSMAGEKSQNGGHLKPVTLKPVIRIFRIFRVFVSAFSAFSAFSFCGVSSDPCFPGVGGTSAFSAFSLYRV